MLDRFLYFVSTFAEAGLAVFGINSIYEQPAYTVRADLGDGLEIRDYRPAPRWRPLSPRRTAIWRRTERSDCCSLTSQGKIAAARPSR